MTLLFILLFSLFGSIGTVLLAGLLFRSRREISPVFKSAILSYATGSLLGAAFLGMIPHALETLRPNTGMAVVLGGIFGFFLLEKLLIWRHCHEAECTIHAQAGPLILVGDAVHNFIDGIAISLAFQHSHALGITTALAVIAHEIPQEVGDIMILVHHGWARKRAIAYNALSSLATLPGALIALWAGQHAKEIIGPALCISAASFIYIALADLTPDHRTHISLRTTFIQCAGILAGIFTISCFHSCTHAHEPTHGSPVHDHTIRSAPE